MEEFINQWGYLAVYIATTVEGELAYITSIVTAKLGHLSVLGVAIAGFLGGMTRDSAIFFTGRYGSRAFLERRPKLLEKINEAGAIVSNRPWWILIFHRYFYGFSTATLLVLATSSMSNARFIALCVTACFVWVLGLGLLGYYATQTVLANLQWLSDHFLWILGAVVALIGTFLYRKR